MTRQEELRERYEEALFALLMDEVARSEGEALLRQTETAPQPRREAERNDLGTIRRTVRQKQTRRVGRASLRVLGKAAMVAGLAASLFLGTFALSEDVRVGTMNLIIEVSEKGTTFSLGNARKSSTTLSALIPKWIPEGFSITDSYADEFESWVHYERSEEEFIEFTCLQADGSFINIDSEDAVVETIQVNGQRATLVEKDASLQLVYLTEDQAYFVQVLSNHVSREDFLQIVDGIT